MMFDPKQFDQYREDNCLEAKAANGGLPGSLWDTYSSFANSFFDFYSRVSAKLLLDLKKPFNLIGLGEHAGSGVPDIYHAWKEVGLEEPVIEERFGK